MFATTVSNYPRTVFKPGGPSIRRAWTQLDRGQATIEDVHKEEDLFTEEFLKEQAEAGLDIATDGQVRWEDGQTYWARGIGGFEITGLIRWFDTNTYYRQPVLKSKPIWKGSIAGRDLRFAIEHSSLPVKAVITGPYTLAKLSADEHFKDFRKYVLALAEVLNQEALSLEPLRPALIQFDEPSIVRPGNQGDWQLFKEALRVATRGLRTKTALYTYFGSAEGLTPELFSLPVNVIGLDFWMGPRNWDLLQGFPADKELGLGILDARNTKLETVEQITEGIRRAGRYVAYDRIHVNPSCGLEFLPRDRARLKIFRLGEAVKHAREVLR